MAGIAEEHAGFGELIAAGSRESADVRVCDLSARRAAAQAPTVPRVHGATSRICNILLKTSRSAATFLFGQSLLEPRVVRAIDYKNFGPVTVTQAQQTLRQKEIELEVEGGWEPNRVKAARAALTELLAAHGMRGARVYVLISEIPPASVGITFRAHPDVPMQILYGVEHLTSLLSRP